MPGPAGHWNFEWKVYMSFLRNTHRKAKSANEIDAINRIVNKYVDFKDLFVKSDFRAEAVQFVGNCGDGCLILRFDQPFLEEAARVNVYTIVRGRFIEFELETLSPAEPKYPSFSYAMKILKCSIALEKREYDRYEFSENPPSLTNIATIKVRERESDFRKSLSVKMIVEEFINKLDGVDFKRVVFRDDQEIPPPVQFVIESGEPLYLKNMAETSGFFSENEELFTAAISGTLKEDLYRWIQNNAGNNKSLLVRPITYYPMVGDEFAVGYVMIINREKEIDESLIQDVDTFIRDLSEKIRNGNLIESKMSGSIVDVSTGGIKIEISDTKLVDKLLSQNVILFEMNFQEGNPILISGHIVYIFKREEGGYLVGVDFSGSRFGPNIRNVLPIHLRNYRRQQRG
jgi:hypothetical protein